MKIKHAVKLTHINGDELAKPVYWCGRFAKRFDWYFSDAQHLALSVGGSQQPCKNCIKAIIKELKKEL